MILWNLSAEDLDSHELGHEMQAGITQNIQESIDKLNGTVCHSSLEILMILQGGVWWLSGSVSCFPFCAA